MSRATLLLACLALVACGADGDPRPQRETGVSISGTATIGVGGRF